MDIYGKDMEWMHMNQDPGEKDWEKTIGYGAERFQQLSLAGSSFHSDFSFCF